MPHDVIMPQMGESIAEGTITTWLQKVGDQVEARRAVVCGFRSTPKSLASSGQALGDQSRVDQTVEINAIVAVIDDNPSAKKNGAQAQASDENGAEQEGGSGESTRAIGAGLPPG
ncbi:MAG: biotin/lipoyl-containing protein [Myxococcota bacterium]